eukprot:710478-Pelagomonas_calceolata.AAC.5
MPAGVNCWVYGAEMARLVSSKSGPCAPLKFKCRGFVLPSFPHKGAAKLITAIPLALYKAGALTHPVRQVQVVYDTLHALQGVRAGMRACYARNA